MVETLTGFARHCAQALWMAVMRFNRDDGWAIASHITLSGVLAFFPFLIFCASLAAFLDLGDFPDTVVHLIFDSWPPAVASPLATEVRAVLTIPRGDVLTLGALVALFFASSGIEALRMGLNRAYEATELRNMFILRAESIIFVVVASVMVATVTFLLVLAPLAVELARRHAPGLDIGVVTLINWRLTISSGVIVVALFATHKWLPAGRRPLHHLFPGIALTLVAWLVASTVFAAYLAGFANYVGTYAGLAGIVVALVFLYMMSAIYLIGAEFNSALIRLAKIPPA